MVVWFKISNGNSPNLRNMKFNKLIINIMITKIQIN